MQREKHKLVFDKIELNEKFQVALATIESGKNVFITGRAGTGKSTLLQYFRAHAKKNIVVLAPTGVAALNVNGQTIHSFFNFKIDVTLSKVKKAWSREVYDNLDAIVIDEISMVRADLLDCVDRFMRLNGKNNKKPFGGAQMIFIGDLYQLPPVVAGDERAIFSSHYDSPYFFSAKVFIGGFEMELVELDKIYRQKDDEFINILNSIRNNSIGAGQLAILNKRFDPEFEPTDGKFFIYLTTNNKTASEINAAELALLLGERREYCGIISGKFDEKYLPTDVELEVKIGAQIMMLNNDSAGRWVNGTLALVIGFNRHEVLPEDIIIAELTDGETVEISRHRWDIYNFHYNKSARRIDSETVGSFAQYPFRLAWAVTIHKSQGKTFERVILDIGKGTFSAGQLYVGLSRCVSLDGLVLKKPIKKNHVWLDWRVVKFVTQFQYNKSETAMSLKQKVKMIEAAIEAERPLEIVYLKANDIRSTRKIIPHQIGEMEYMGKIFFGVEAYCVERKEERVFRVDRILEMRETTEKNLPKL